MYRMSDFLNRWGKAIILGTVLVFCFSPPALGKSKGHNGKKGTFQGQAYIEEKAHKGRHRGNVLVQKGKSNETLSPDEKAGLKKKIKKWKSLPPEKQNVLRHRMDQLKKLPPESRKLYKKRFDQLQKLSPQERQRIQKKLDNWDSLSPREKEEIRQRFHTQ